MLALPVSWNVYCDKWILILISLGLNIGADKEAAEHFLSALALQDSSTNGDTSDQLWFTLRRALLSMVFSCLPMFDCTFSLTF